MGSQNELDYEVGFDNHGCQDGTRNGRFRVTKGLKGNQNSSVPCTSVLLVTLAKLVLFPGAVVLAMDLYAMAIMRLPMPICSKLCAGMGSLLIVRVNQVDERLL